MHTGSLHSGRRARTYQRHGGPVRGGASTTRASTIRESAVYACVDRLQVAARRLAARRRRSRRGDAHSRETASRRDRPRHRGCSRASRAGVRTGPPPRGCARCSLTAVQSCSSFFTRTDPKRPSKTCPVRRWRRVELLGEAAVQPLHAGAEVGERRLDQEVDVVVHQAEGETVPALPHDHAGQQVEVRAAIGVVQVDELAAVTAGEDVVHAACQLHTRLASHAPVAGLRGCSPPQRGLSP